MSDPVADWAFLGSRVLMVSRFPPARDGIARYAEQLAVALEESGRSVDRLGLPLRPGVMLARARAADDVLVQYHPHYFTRGSAPNQALAYLVLAGLARRTRATWIVHEPEEPTPAELGRRGRLEHAVLEGARRVFWRAARRVVFHSGWEADGFARRFPARRRETVLVDHGAFFTAEISADRREARRRLGLPGDRAVALCIGTLSPHKGVDRVIAAVADAGVGELDLWIVGAPIRQMPDVLAHVEELRRLSAGEANVHLREGFLDDATFDLWIRAADAVVVAYRTAASSGVVARAHLLGTPLITSAAGGIAEQAAPGDRRFTSDAELVDALRQVALGRGRT